MKKLVLSLLAVAVAAGLNAQILWKVSGNGAKGDSYLFGTHHVAPVSILDSTPGFNEALSSVDDVIGEIDMATMATPEAQQVMMSFAMAPADSTLSKVLTTEQLDSVNKVLAKYTNGMLTAAQLEPMKPCMISTQLAMFQSMVAFPGFNPQVQLDSEIQTRGKAQSKEIKGFETLEQQLGWLMGDPITEQVENLMNDIRKDDVSIGHAQALAKAYTDGNLEEIEKIMFNEENGMSEEVAERLLFNRNNNWVAELKEILPGQNVLVAVGVGHLVGEKGLISQLQKLGYTVTPVK